MKAGNAQMRHADEYIMLIGGVSISHGALLIYTNRHAMEEKLQRWTGQRDLF